MISFRFSKGQNRLEVSHYPAGVYLIKIHPDENVIIKTFVKKSVVNYLKPHSIYAK